MPTYEDPLGDFDHVEPIPLKEAQEKWWAHLRLMGDFMIPRLIASHQQAENKSRSQILIKKYDELEILLNRSVRQA